MKKKIFLLSLIFIILFTNASWAIYRCLITSDVSLGFNLFVYSTEQGGPVYAVNVPKVVEGMIPIKWDDTSSTWVITNNNDTNWYDYSAINKDWANVMLSDGRYKIVEGIVTDSNTSTAVLTDGSVQIAEADLGSMYVWIPRYEYKITYYTDSMRTVLSTDNAKTNYGFIDINFLSGKSTLKTDEYVIHPAFRNGTNSGFLNGEWDSEITGFWFAKFEGSNELNLSYSTTAQYVKILPNKKSWSNQNVGSFYSKCKSINSAENATYYGISTDKEEIDPHMMKNSEWGAVAYLAYSQYGRNGAQVNINTYWYAYGSNKNYTCTGYAYSSTLGTAQTDITIANIPSENKYIGEYGVLGSTTGNTTGIYDMVGGLNEYVAAYLSGTTATVGGALLSETEQKYYTVYPANIAKGTTIGDATNETASWDSNYIASLSSSTPFILRGGTTTNGNASSRGGLFSVHPINGESNAENQNGRFRGVRPVLIVK